MTLAALETENVGVMTEDYEAMTSMWKTLHSVGEVAISRFEKINGTSSIKKLLEKSDEESYITPANTKWRTVLSLRQQAATHRGINETAESNAQAQLCDLQVIDILLSGMARKVSLQEVLEKDSIIQGIVGQSDWYKQQEIAIFLRQNDLNNLLALWEPVIWGPKVSTDEYELIRNTVDTLEPFINKTANQYFSAHFAKAADNTNSQQKTVSIRQNPIDIALNSAELKRAINVRSTILQIQSQAAEGSIFEKLDDSVKAVRADIGKLHLFNQLVGAFERASWQHVRTDTVMQSFTMSAMKASSPYSKVELETGLQTTQLFDRLGYKNLFEMANGPAYLLT